MIIKFKALLKNNGTEIIPLMVHHNMKIMRYRTNLLYTHTIHHMKGTLCPVQATVQCPMQAQPLYGHRQRT